MRCQKFRLSHGVTVILLYLLQSSYQEDQVI